MADELAERVERIETILRANRLHEPNCPANHDCDRDHPTAAIWHAPQPCACWLAEDESS